MWQSKLECLFLTSIFDSSYGWEWVFEIYPYSWVLLGAPLMYATDLLTNIGLIRLDWKGLVGTNQGDQIGQFFNIWLLFTRVFLKFYLNKQFQNTICFTYFNIQKQFDATIFDFQFKHLYFGYSLGYISENWAIFSNFWSLWHKHSSLFRQGIIEKREKVFESWNVMMFVENTILKRFPLFWRKSQNFEMKENFN